MDARRRCGPGEIRGLLQLIEEHPAEFTHDWRTRFGLPLSALFDGTVSWTEAHYLASVLLSDPTSQLAAAAAGWDHPWSYEAMVLADLYDLFLAANTDRRKRGSMKPYKRPFKQANGTRRSRPPMVDQAAVRAALAARGHHLD